METEDIPERWTLNNDNMYHPDSPEKSIYSNSIIILEN